MAESFFKTEDEIQEYKDLGFIFEEEELGFVVEKGLECYCDSEDNKDLTIEIKTMDELMAFVEKYGDVVVCPNEIIIYNN